MPFKSRSQMRACFAKKDPKWDCKKWAKHTKNKKSLPEKKEVGGMLRPKECKYGGKCQKGGYFDPITGQWIEPGGNQLMDFENPYIESSRRRTDPIEPIFEREDVMTPAEQFTNISDEQMQGHFSAIKGEKKKNKWNPYLMLRGATTLGSFLGGVLERGRQNQYMYEQLSSLGQRDPMPTEMFQPTPYNLYAKFGGRLRGY